MKIKLLISLFVLFATPYWCSAQTLHSATWTDGVACIVYSHCTPCHNNQGIGPFPLTTYNEVYANRFSIAASVQARSMPPFPALQVNRRYAHANTLADHEINEIVDWVNNFAPLGNPAQNPTPPVYSSAFQIPNPDTVYRIPNYTVNTTTDLYRVFVLPMGNNTSRNITGIEVVPGNREIVHHVLVFQDTSGIPMQRDLADPLPGYTAFGGTGSNSSKLITGYVPGQGSLVYPAGFGESVSPNSYLCIQVHYPGGINGQTDSTSVRIKYGPSSGLRNMLTLPILNHGPALVNGPLSIPANTMRTFRAEYTLPVGVTLLGILPHMHLIGKSMLVYAIKPGGDTVHLANIPEWDFHWQMYYRFQRPIYLPPGTKGVAVATYDNTTANSNNPNVPPQNVTLGEGTGDEMMLVYFNFTTQGASPLDTNLVIDTAGHWTHDSLSCALVAGQEPVLPEWADQSGWHYNVLDQSLTVKGPAQGGFYYALRDLQGKLLCSGQAANGQSSVHQNISLAGPGVWIGSITDAQGRSYYRKWTFPWR